MTRIVDLARIQNMNWRMAVGMPLGITAMILLLTVVLAALAGNGFNTGGLSAIFLMIGIAQVQVITQFFPFALGLSASRTEFYASTLLVALVQAIAFGLVLTLGLVVEVATGGWGVNLGFFRLGVPADNPLLAWLIFAVTFLASSTTGSAFGTVFKRWGQLGVYAVLLGLAAALVGTAAIIGGQGWWPQVIPALANLSTAAVVVLPLLLSVVLAGAGWLLLRRATP